MGARGPVPKDPAKRQRRNADGVELELGTTPVKDAPKLPNASRYLASTRNWYLTWTRSAQASLFTGTDWQRLHMLAPLVDAYYRFPDRGTLAEIRANEKELGATVESRQRLKIRIRGQGLEEPGVEDKGISRQGRRSRARKDPRKSELRVLEGGKK